jgi:magnesium chelatase family protein
VAAAGGHSLLLVGPTGVGKSLLARCLPGLLPPLAQEEAREVAAAYARAGEPPPPGRPVRAPGLGLSPARLRGGGRRPGELDLARCGVLVLDDLAVLDRVARQALCEALDRLEEEPSWQLIAALRPCPCGSLGDLDEACGCPPGRVRRHRARFDDPLIDRIDLHVEAGLPTPRELAHAGEGSAAVAARVAAACRFRGGLCSKAGALDPFCRDLLAAAVERLRLSPRAVSRVRRVARTIADLAGSPQISRYHFAEALAYRYLFRSEAWLAPARAGESEPGTDGRPRRGPTAAPVR